MDGGSLAGRCWRLRAQAEQVFIHVGSKYVFCGPLQRRTIVVGDDGGYTCLFRRENHEAMPSLDPLNHLLVVVFLHLEPRRVLRQRLDSARPYLASRGVLLADSVDLFVSAAHAVDGVLPLPHEVLALRVQPPKVRRGIV